MTNPYEATAAISSHRVRRRAVRRYLVLCSFLCLVAILIALPGLTLLNQEWQLIPTRSSIYDVEINGQSVSNETAIRYTLGSGLALAIVGLVLAGMSFFNYQHNRKICSESR